MSKIDYDKPRQIELDNLKRLVNSLDKDIFLGVNYHWHEGGIIEANIVLTHPVYLTSVPQEDVK